MMSLRVTSPIEEEGVDADGADQDGAEREEGAIDLDCLDLNCASLRLTVEVSMANIKEKGLDTGKGIEKWCKILVIVEGKTSLSRDSESLWTFMIERIK